MINFYIVATPIGNYEDITLRALKILKSVDFIVCEQEKEYKKLFSILKIEEKKFILCNEHYEKESIELAIPLLKNGEKGALISDCGTPLFEDPGFKLLQTIRREGFSVTALPGANSIITALSLAPFKVKDFYYSGLLPRNNDDRQKRLIKILKRRESIVIIESPYRLLKILSAIADINSKRKVFLAYNLTMENEFLIWGSPGKIKQNLQKQNIKKGEFIIIVE